jgi:hypothetical protein
MALNRQQINRLLNEARAEGLDDDELATLEEMLLDRALELKGAERLDMALSLAPEDELQAAETFMSDMNAERVAAMARGAADLNSMSEDEWQRLIG